MATQSNQNQNRNQNPANLNKGKNDVNAKAGQKKPAGSLRNSADEDITGGQFRNTSSNKTGQATSNRSTRNNDAE